MAVLKKLSIKIILINLLVVLGLGNQDNLTAQSLTLDHLTTTNSEFDISPSLQVQERNISKSSDQSIMRKAEVPKLQKGFFCKAEDKIWEKSNIAFRFRLGSLNYVDWMENKSHFYQQY